MNHDALSAFNALLSKIDNIADIKIAFALVKDRGREIQRADVRVKVASGMGPGAKVKFVARGTAYEGTVEKVNGKTVNVRTTAGITWRVSPGVLSLA